MLVPVPVTLLVGFKTIVSVTELVPSLIMAVPVPAEGLVSDTFDISVPVTATV